MLLDDLEETRNTNKSIPVITVDGPSGSGKGTISSQLAKELGWHFLDSGALYRACAFIAKATSTPLEEDPLSSLIKTVELHFLIEPRHNTLRILWGQHDITAIIRSEEYGYLASQIAIYPKVRQALLASQHAFRKAPGLIADGRDMGTVVFPDARLKIFLSATIEERAKRRYLQLKAKRKHVSLESVQIELEQRDYQDKQRSIAPLKAAKDAFIIDTTHLSIQEVLQRIKAKLQMLN